MRTYLKNIRNVQLLCNSLLSEKQRSLMNFQKLKVIDSGTTSESDERYYEPNIAIKKADSKLYKKQKHTEETNKMLAGYVKQREISDIDARLLVGVASKVPMQDLPAKGPPAVQHSIEIIEPIPVKL